MLFKLVSYSPEKCAVLRLGKKRLLPAMYIKMLSNEYFHVHCATGESTNENAQENVNI